MIREKVCPKCSTLTILDDEECVACGYVYQTLFDANARAIRSGRTRLNRRSSWGCLLSMLSMLSILSMLPILLFLSIITGISISIIWLGLPFTVLK